MCCLKQAVEWAEDVKRWFKNAHKRYNKAVNLFSGGLYDNTEILKRIL
jgi:hypothetical protein